ncbi:hypothetical protein Z949_1265 [Sulfitobacter guttiformis KCTC 32187]|uniref:Uncharacterized protein n=1 Tax=Sulfitobacter guttiformis TaxID=74349 RepID=A0A420DIQ8_9RHOB|nr:hypothetical protein Z949_1265 [Sulfitobacter guttiformis KCTC 32187]RKE94126.1 hypothetical protein C8N30_3235 [Sulfitobacter guttiformis]
MAAAGRADTVKAWGYNARKGAFGPFFVGVEGVAQQASGLVRQV